MSSSAGFRRVALAMSAASGMNLALAQAMAQDPSSKQAPEGPPPAFNGTFDFASAAQNAESPTTKNPLALQPVPGSYELIEDGFRRVRRTETVHLTREQIAEWNAAGKGDRVQGDRVEVNTFTDYLPANWMQGFENLPPGARVDSYGNPIINDAFALPGWAQKDVDDLRQEIANWLQHLDNLDLALEGRADLITNIPPRAVAESYLQSEEELRSQRFECEVILGNYFGQTVVRGIDASDILPIGDERLSAAVVDSLAKYLHFYEGLKAQHASRLGVAPPVPAYPPSIVGLLSAFGHSMQDILTLPPGDEGGTAGASTCYFRGTGLTGMTATVTGIGIWNGNTVHDDEQADIPIGFRFHYNPCEDGDANLQVRVSTNGYITFVDQGGATGSGTIFGNVPIPDVFAPNGFAAPWWDDLEVRNQGTLDEVVYKLEGAVSQRVLTVEYWSISRHAGLTTEFYYFQVKLFEQNGEVQFHYDSSGYSPDNGESRTVGIENYSGTLGDCGPSCGSLIAGAATQNYSFASIVMPNDNCGSATCVLDGDSVPGHNFGAGGSDITPNCAVNDFADVWYRYHSPGSGTLTVSTCASAGFDTVISVHSACGGTPIDCDDDACGPSLRSLVSIPVSAGDYLIRVAGYSGHRGLFTLTVDSTVVPSVGETCADAVPIVIPGTASTQTTADNTGCEFICLGVIDEWLLWTAPASGVMRATTCTAGSAFDTTLQVYSGACGSLTTIACNDDAFGSCGLLSRVMWVADAGVTYRLRVAGFGSQTGNYNLALNYSTCPADISPNSEGDNVVDINDLLAVINGWGACSNCRADFEPSGGDNSVSINELLAVINAWGACPP